MDARHCPTCGARGILPLDQPKDERGRIVDPAMIFPSCETEFRAEGMTWLGAVRPPITGTEEELEAWAAAFVDAILGRDVDAQPPVA